VERTINMINMISNISPKAATPPISSAAKVEDTDMARSLIGIRIITSYLD
jgi:hypothetical protein